MAECGGLLNDPNSVRIKDFHEESILYSTSGFVSVRLNAIGSAGLYVAGTTAIVQHQEWISLQPYNFTASPEHCNGTQ